MIEIEESIELGQIMGMTIEKLADTLIRMHIDHDCKRIDFDLPVNIKNQGSHLVKCSFEIIRVVQ